MDSGKVLLGVLLASSSCFAQSAYLAPTWQYLYQDSKVNDTTYQGSMGGLCLGYDYIERDGLYFKAEFSFMSGPLHHHGKAHRNTQEYIPEVDFGYDVSSLFGKNFSMIPFVGLGAYVFYQDAAAADFKSYFWYVPIGISFEYRFSKSWKLALVGYGAPCFAAQIHIQSWANQQATVSGLWSVQIPISYRSVLPLEFVLTPFSKGWAFESLGNYLGSRQTYFGLKFSLGYSF